MPKRQNERMNRKTGATARHTHCSCSRRASILAPEMETNRTNLAKTRRRLPLWLHWSMAISIRGGMCGLGSKIASAGVDAYANQVLYTVGLAPLMIFVAWTVHKHSAADAREGRRTGVFWAFLTGILGGAGNLAFFHALVKGGNASVVAPVTALFPMVTVLLALIFLKERLGRVQWVGLALAFVAIYLLSA